MSQSAIRGDLEHARALLDVGRWEHARDILTQSLTTHPDSNLALCLLAQAHQRGGNWTAMLRFADAAAAAAPDDEWAHRQRAAALRHLDHPAESVAAARTAVRCAPHLWLTHADLATALLAFRTRAARREAYLAAQYARKLAPDEPGVYLTIGRTYEAIGDRRRSRQAEETALSLDPEHVIARHNLAVNDLHGGRITSAARRLSSVAAQRPQEQLFHRNAQIAATAWLFRRADFAALAWAAVIAISWSSAVSWSSGIPWSDTWPDVGGVTPVLALACFLAATWLAYQRLPPALQRMVQHPGHDRRRILALVSTVLPLGALTTRSIVINEATAAVGMTNAGLTNAAKTFAILAYVCVLLAGARLRNRVLASAVRFCRRWWYRLVVLRSGDQYP